MIYVIVTFASHHPLLVGPFDGERVPVSRMIEDAKAAVHREDPARANDTAEFHVRLAVAP